MALVLHTWWPRGRNCTYVENLTRILNHSKLNNEILFGWMTNKTTQTIRFNSESFYQTTHEFYELTLKDMRHIFKGLY